MVLGVPLFATIIELTNEFLNKRLEDKGISIETDEEVTEKEKSIFQREAINLSDGYGSLTKQEKTRLFAFSLARKYDLYTQQDNTTLAACVREYQETTKEPNEQVTDTSETEEDTITSNFDAAQPIPTEE